MQQNFQTELERQLAADNAELAKSKAYFDEAIRKSNEFLSQIKATAERNHEVSSSITTGISTGPEVMVDDMPTAFIEVKKEEKLPSLWQLQDRLAEAEEQINNADDARLQEIMGDIRHKVDGVKYMIDILESEASRFKLYKDQMAQRQKSLEKAAERIKRYTITCLRAHDTEFEVGLTWTAKIAQSEKLVTFKDSPDESDYVALGLNYPVIRQKYEWDKNEIKSLLKSGNQDLLAYAKIDKSDNLNFKTNNRAVRANS